MSIFSKMMSKIFGHETKPEARVPTPSTQSAPTSAPATATATAAPVDVEAVLENIASKYNHQVNWRHSIVDLMSILGIDNSLADRRELAKELGYTGDMNDTAPMNIWLHKQVMRKLAENGGKVPADLLD
jgi:hypothetical protein